MITGEDEKFAYNNLWQSGNPYSKKGDFSDEFRDLIKVEDPETPKKEIPNPSATLNQTFRCYGRHCGASRSTKIGLCNSCGSNISQRILFVLLIDEIPSEIISLIYDYSANEMGNFIFPVPRRTHLCCLVDCIEPYKKYNLCEKHKDYFR